MYWHSDIIQRSCKTKMQARARTHTDFYLYTCIIHKILVYSMLSRQNDDVWRMFMTCDADLCVLFEDVGLQCV